MARKAGTYSWAKPTIIDKGIDALSFVIENRVDLEPRLAPGLIDGLGVDLQSVGAKIPTALQKKLAVGIATSSERLTAEQTKKLLGKLRRALQSAPAGTVDLKAFGVGLRVDERVNKTVIAAGNTFLVAAGKPEGPAQLRAAGILDADVARLASGIAALAGKDADQTTARQNAKSAKRDLEATYARIEQAVRSVSSAGDLTYDDDPREAQALALIPSAPVKKKPAKQG